MVKATPEFGKVRLLLCIMLAPRDRNIMAVIIIRKYLGVRCEIVGLNKNFCGVWVWQIEVSNNYSLGKHPSNV